MARADEATLLWGYKSKLGRLLRGFGTLSQSLTSFQPLAMTETTTQPRFITRLLTGASLRGGSKGFYGPTMARADEAIFLWGYKSKLGRLLRGFGIFSQCLTSFQPLAMTETTTQPRFITRLLTGASLRGGSKGFMVLQWLAPTKQSLNWVTIPNYEDCRGTCQLSFITYSSGTSLAMTLHNKEIASGLLNSFSMFNIFLAPRNDGTDHTTTYHN